MMKPKFQKGSNLGIRFHKLVYKRTFDSMYILYMSYRSPKIQQTKILVTCQRFCDFFLSGLVWQYSTNQKQYNLGRFKVIATFLKQ